MLHRVAHAQHGTSFNATSFPKAWTSKGVVTPTSSPLFDFITFPNKHNPCLLSQASTGFSPASRDEDVMALPLAGRLSTRRVFADELVYGVCVSSAVPMHAAGSETTGSLIPYQQGIDLLQMVVIADGRALDAARICYESTMNSARQLPDAAMGYALRNSSGNERRLACTLEGHHTSQTHAHHS